MSLKDFFKSEDFNSWSKHPQTLTSLANQKLNKWLEENAIKVTGNLNAYGIAAVFDTSKNRDHTHQALLINIEPIEKKKCEHVPRLLITERFEKTHNFMEMQSSLSLDNIKCADCGVKLKATFTEEK